jgi:MFS family permease
MNEKKAKFGKDFLLIVIGQIISLFGNGILRFALPLYLLRETGSSALFGIVTACSLLPMIVLSLLGGVLADNVNKRNIMVGLDFFTAAVITAFYIFKGIMPTVPLFTITLMLLYGISGTYQPAVQASIPALVPKERILSASAIVNQIGALANFMGPIIGGMLYGVWGIKSILQVSIMCFLLSAVMELFIVIPFQKQAEKRSIGETVKNDLRESLHFLRLEKPIFIKLCIVIAGLNLFLSSMITIGIPVIIIDALSLTDQMLGITQGLLAVGGIVGGLLTALFEKKLRPNKASVFLYLCAGFTCVMGLGMMPQGGPLFQYAILSCMGMAIMAASTMFSIQMLAVVQTQTPSHLVGKVIACIMTLIMCSQPVGQLLYGLLFEVLSQSIGAVILGSGIISLLIAMYSKKILKQFGENGGMSTE